MFPRFLTDEISVMTQRDYHDNKAYVSDPEDVNQSDTSDIYAIGDSPFYFVRDRQIMRASPRRAARDVMIIPNRQCDVPRFIIKLTRDYHDNESREGFLSQSKDNELERAIEIAFDSDYAAQTTTFALNRSRKTRYQSRNPHPQAGYTTHHYIRCVVYVVVTKTCLQRNYNGHLSLPSFGVSVALDPEQLQSRPLQMSEEMDVSSLLQVDQYFELKEGDVSMGYLGSNVGMSSVVYSVTIFERHRNTYWYIDPMTGEPKPIRATVSDNIEPCIVKLGLEYTDDGCEDKKYSAVSLDRLRSLSIKEQEEEYRRMGVFPTRNDALRHSRYNEVEEKYLTRREEEQRKENDERRRESDNARKHETHVQRRVDWIISFLSKVFMIARKSFGIPV